MLRRRGVGLVTVTEPVPAEARSVAGIVAVREVLLTNVEVSAEPFQFTVDAAMKFEPVSVMVVAADPAVLEAGLRLLRAGTGFFATGEEVDPEPPHPRINKRRLMV
jgi:hypothetical protein